jgi:hypothetical protein
MSKWRHIACPAFASRPCSQVSATSRWPYSSVTFGIGGPKIRKLAPVAPAPSRKASSIIRFGDPAKTRSRPRIRQLGTRSAADPASSSTASAATASSTISQALGR